MSPLGFLAMEKAGSGERGALSCRVGWAGAGCSDTLQKVGFLGRPGVLACQQPRAASLPCSAGHNAGKGPVP